MSTRATIHWKDGNKRDEAITYRHGDGYPEGLGKDIQDFFQEVSKLSDPRFCAPSHLAAKWIVWDANQTSKMRCEIEKKEHNPLNFLSVGIVLKDPSDIAYRYDVICKDDSIPEVKVKKVG